MNKEYATISAQYSGFYLPIQQIPAIVTNLSATAGLNIIE